ncbi:MAG: hypothetical protein JRE73_14865 [Deltaproteobacteria bacterium]|nr:hypothetical protein [Deltaproteobacteria bacterium]
MVDSEAAEKIFRHKVMLFLFICAYSGAHQSQRRMTLIFSAVPDVATGFLMNFARGSRGTHREH